MKNCKEAIAVLYKKKILGIIKNFGVASTDMILKASGMDPAAFNNVTGNLLEQGIIKELPLRENPDNSCKIEKLLTLNKDSYYVIGIEVAYNIIRCVLTNLDGDVIKKEEVQMDFVITFSDNKISGNNFKQLSETIAATVRRMTGQYNLKDLIGIGISYSDTTRFSDMPFTPEMKACNSITHSDTTRFSDMPFTPEMKACNSITHSDMTRFSDMPFTPEMKACNSITHSDTTRFSDIGNKTLLAFKDIDCGFVKTFLENEFHIPVYEGYIPQTSIYAETWFGDNESRNTGDVIYLHVGESIMISIKSGGKLIRGYAGLSGQLGHIKAGNGRKKCECGNYGCLQTEASAISIIRSLVDIIKDGAESTILERTEGDLSKLDIDMVRDVAGKDDRIVTGILRKAGKDIGTALSGALNIFSPRMVIMGGELFQNNLQYNDFLYECIYNTVKENCLPVIFNEVIFKRALYSKSKGVLGAAAMVLHNYFT